MSTPAGQRPLTPGDKDFLDQVVGFAERHAINGVMINTVYSRKLNVPVVFIVALGEQALAVQDLLMKAEAPPAQSVEVVSNLDITGGKQW